MGIKCPTVLGNLNESTPGCNRVLCRLFVLLAIIPLLFSTLLFWNKVLRGVLKSIEVKLAGQ
jgi:hypothetical protein